MKISQMTDKRFKASVEKLMKQQLPIQVAYKLKGVISKLDVELTKYNELHANIIKKYSVKKEDGSIDINEEGMVLIPNESILDANKELVELNSIEVDIESISLDDLGKNLEMSVE